MLQHLNVQRFFSDRLLMEPRSPVKFRVAHSCEDWGKRVFSWICSPLSYKTENRHTIAFFKRYLSEVLGPQRLKRICQHYSVDFDALEEKGSPLLSRDLAKVVTGALDVKVEDVEEYIRQNQAQFPGIENFQQLSCSVFAQVYRHLSSRLPWTLCAPAQRITGRPTEWLARLYFDRFLADRERLAICKENSTDTADLFFHNLTARVIKRELEVGMLVPAPNHPLTRISQFYYVAAKLVTGEGLVSYILLPVGQDNQMEAVRVHRNTSPRLSEIDSSSTLITDLEKDLARTAYESGVPYEQVLRERLPLPKVEAGHSLGAAIVQYRLANLSYIQKAYLYASPGIPLAEVEKFNRKRDRVQLFIRRCSRDLICKVGQAHLGYRAPPDVVEVDYVRFHSPRHRAGHDPHSDVLGRDRLYFGMEGGVDRQHIDLDLYHETSFRERLRSFLGPPLAFVLRILRNLCRFLVSSRADMYRGVTIGSIVQGRWHVTHIRV